LKWSIAETTTDLQPPRLFAVVPNIPACLVFRTFDRRLLPGSAAYSPYGNYYATTTSMGRLFDTVGSLLGFTREISFEGQAAMWLEHIARRAMPQTAYPFPVTENGLDFRPLLEAVIHDRRRGRDPAEIARAFHHGVATAVCEAIALLGEAHSTDIGVLSGGVFQNELLLRDIKSLLAPEAFHIWTNSAVPPNDGGISLGQAAIACMNYPLQ